MKIAYVEERIAVVLGQFSVARSGGGGSGHGGGGRGATRHGGADKFAKADHASPKAHHSEHDLNVNALHEYTKKDSTKRDERKLKKRKGSSKHYSKASTYIKNPLYSKKTLFYVIGSRPSRGGNNR